MGENVIRFPTERRLQAAARSRADAGQAQAAPATEVVQADGEPFAFLSVEIRRLPRPESRIGGEIAGRILNRCVLASLEVLSKEKIPVDLAGSVLRPVIEATFGGADGAGRAAGAAVAMREAVGRVQREMEREFHVFGAITTGATVSLQGGVKVTTGSPEQVAARFREHAVQGQVLLSEPAWRACEERVQIGRPAIPVTVPGSDPLPGYPLNGLT